MDANRPLISVIVPVYKVEHYLSDCLDSILAQSYTNLEVLLVDDGSPDDSGTICDAYAQKDSRVRVIHQENAGVSAARNAAMDIATGDYYAFVDSDDTIDKEMFSILYENLLATGADVSGCERVRIVNGTPEPVGKEYFLTMTAQEAVSNMLLGRHFTGSLCNKLFSRKTIGHLRLARDVYHAEDLLLSTEAILNGTKMCYTSKPLYHYYVRGGSATNAGFTQKHMTAITVNQRILALIKDRGLCSLVKYAEAALLIGSYVLMRRLYNSDKATRKAYAPLLRKGILQYKTKENLALLSKKTAFKVRLIGISYRLYFLAVNFV